MKTTSLTPLYYKQDGAYRFELTSSFKVRVEDFSGRVGPGFREFSTEENGPWLRLDADGTLTVLSGYAWDGCSPAFQLGQWWIGTPTPESTRAACLVHDALYQFLDEGLWNRSEADAVFLALMQSGGFPLAPVYYGAVRIFGGLHHMIFR